MPDNRGSRGHFGYYSVFHITFFIDLGYESLIRREMRFVLFGKKAHQIVHTLQRSAIDA